MSPAPTKPTALPDARAETLVGAYERAGYGRATPAILQPADRFSTCRAKTSAAACI